MADVVLVVDGQLGRESSLDRKVIDVAVGILISSAGALLLTSRPSGKAYAGFWEFPGGKLEANESVEQALRRELQEEIGLTIGSAPVWREQLVDYPMRWCVCTFARSVIGLADWRCVKAKPSVGSTCLSRWRLSCRARCQCWHGWLKISLESPENQF